MHSDHGTRLVSSRDSARDCMTCPCEQSIPRCAWFIRPDASSFVPRWQRGKTVEGPSTHCMAWSQPFTIQRINDTSRV